MTRANKWLKRTPPSVTPPAGKDGRRRATLRLRRLATPLGAGEFSLGKAGLICAWVMLAGLSSSEG